MAMAMMASPTLSSRNAPLLPLFQKRRLKATVSLLSFNPPRRACCPPLACSSSFGGGGGGGYGHGGSNSSSTVHPRPQEIQWSKDLANSVHLIGIVGSPVQIKHLSSGKAVAWTRIGVFKSSNETSWVNLTFWDELANVANEHLVKGQQVYVSGRLVSDVVDGDENEKPQVYYKVVVQQLNLVERSYPKVPLYENGAKMDHEFSDEKFGDFVSQSSGSSTEELWQAFFANPLDWWDNRNNKKNPKYPDFKHKSTGESLWVDGKYNPSWVRSQLDVLDSRMSAMRDLETNSPSSFMRSNEITPY